MYKKRTTWILSVLLVILVIALFLGCGSLSDMPYNGEASFHDVFIEIPEDYIRDSTQSTEDLWIFEHGGYKEYILLSRKDANADTSVDLDSYLAYMKDRGAASERTKFIGIDSVFSAYMLDGVFCQEMLFIYKDSYYAIALRGGSEEEFNALLDTVKIQ